MLILLLKDQIHGLYKISIGNDFIWFYSKLNLRCIYSCTPIKKTFMNLYTSCCSLYIYLFRALFPFTCAQHKWLNYRKLPLSIFCASITPWIMNTLGVSSFRWRPTYWRSEWSWHKLCGWGSEVVLQRLGESTLPQGALPGLHLHY